jgi:hypothetical protein
MMAVTVELESLRSLVMVFLQFPQRAAENPLFGGIMAANEQVLAPEQK